MDREKRFSRKRQAVYDYIKASKEHPAAERIFFELRPQIPDLSLATVYRNLSRFKEEGLILSVGTVRGQERFDADLSTHAHFVCVNCGAVVDVDTDLDREKLILRASDATGAEVREVALTFSGICDRCSK